MRSFDASARKRRRRAEKLGESQPGSEAPSETPSSKDSGTLPAMQLPEDRIVGVVEAIEDDMATVLVGADEVEFSFPMSLLPETARVGTMLYLVLRDGRLEVVGERPVHKAELGGAVQDRLERGITQRRLRDLGKPDDT